MCTCRLPLSEGCSQLSYIFKWIFLSWLHCGYLNFCRISEWPVSQWVNFLSDVVCGAKLLKISSGLRIYSPCIPDYLPTYSTDTESHPVIAWKRDFSWPITWAIFMNNSCYEIPKFFQSTAASVMVCSDIFFGWWLMPFPLLSILDSFFLRHPK